jgi:ABC-type bacteriocin/lantibiotic exporter with double-glycine peptidase domain
LYVASQCDPRDWNRDWNAGLGAHLAISSRLTVGELIAFNMVAGRVAEPVLRLAQVWQDFHQARVSGD